MSVTADDELDDVFVFTDRADAFSNPNALVSVVDALADFFNTSLRDARHLWVRLGVRKAINLARIAGRGAVVYHEVPIVADHYGVCGTRDCVRLRDLLTVISFAAQCARRHCWRHLMNQRLAQDDADDPYEMRWAAASRAVRISAARHARREASAATKHARRTH